MLAQGGATVHGDPIVERSLGLSVLVAALALLLILGPPLWRWWRHQ